MPRVAQNVIDQRRREMALVLRDHAYLPIDALCKRFGISEATARRDLAALSRQKRVIRTFGGAMADYDRRFAPLAQRVKLAASAKMRIAQRAAALVRPGTTVFLDAGTTLLAVADAIRKAPPPSLRVVTNSLAVVDRLGVVEGIDVDLLGGRLLPNQSVLLGPTTVRAVAAYEIDLALLGAEGINAQGIWNSAQDVVELQRAVVARSARHALCADKRKLDKTAPAFLLPLSDVDLLVSDADAAALKATGIRLAGANLIQA